MSVIQIMPGILALMAGGSSPPPPGVQGVFVLNGTETPWSVQGPSPLAPTYAVNVPFGSTDSTGTYHAFEGNSWLQTPLMTGYGSILCINLWFYPTIANMIIMTMQGSQTENTGYTASLLEINSSNQLVAGFWNQHFTGGLTTSETVNTNTWNHVYLYNDGVNTVMQLNGGAIYSTPHAWTTPDPLPLVLGAGTISVTNFGTSNRFQGRLGQLWVDYAVVPSTYAATKSQYQPSFAISLDATYNPAWTSADDVITTAPSLGYGANGLVIFLPQDATQGSLSNVAVGWTVTNSAGPLGTVINRGEFGYPGAVRIDTPSWGSPPYTFSPPSNVWRSTDQPYFYATLRNTPTYSAGPPALFAFDANSLEYATVPNQGDISRWSLECWVRVTSSLTGVTTMIVGNQFDGISRLNFSIGTNNSPGNYNINTGFFDGAWRTAGNLTPVLNTWYHVIGTYDGATVKQYVNGTLEGSFSYVGTPQSGGEIYLAKRWDLGAVSDHFPGDIAVARVYKGALSEGEVDKLWAATRSYFGY